MGDPSLIVALRHLVFNQRAIQTFKPHASGFVEYYDAETPGLAAAFFASLRLREAPGPYGIGTATYELKNAPQQGDLVIQVWYPVPDLKGTPTGITSRPDLLQSAYASFTGLPAPVFDNLRLVKTHAILNAPMPPDRSQFPIVLFSHGPLIANRSQSVFQMEALASRGFIAVAIDHAGYASTTIFPDGHAVLPDPHASWSVFADAQSTAMLNTRVADVRFVIDRLEALNEDDPGHVLTGRLDIARLGCVGASFGGSVVVQALLDEPRIKPAPRRTGNRTSWTTRSPSSAGR